MEHSPPSPAASPACGTPVTRVEWLFVIGLFLVGAGLRCALPSRMAVEHFDEGVYASNLLFDADYGYHYPDQHLYAPPLFPWLIEWVFILSGPSNFGAMLPSLAAGCLTVPLVWWVGRNWFSPAAGLASATLCALSDAHIVFSRTALTDVLLCFWLLLAVYFIWRALTGGGLWPTVAAGFFTSLAWWTKYNGWLPLAIGGAAIGPWWLSERFALPAAGDADPRPGHKPGKKPAGSGSSAGAVPPSITTALLRWSLIAATAIALWSPWVWSLQSVGGYAAVSANHARYLVGLAGWTDSLQWQFDNLTRLEGSAGQHAAIAAVLIALAWGVYGTSRFTWNQLAGAWDTWLALGLLLAFSALFHGWLLVAIMGGISLLAAPVFVRNIADPPMRHRVGLAAWLVAAWFVGLTLTTPLYTPYPRLTLPWMMSTWFAGGLGCYFVVSFLGQVATAQQASASRFLSSTLLRQSRVPRGVLLGGAIGGGLALVYTLEASSFRSGVPGWEQRSTIQLAAAAIDQACAEDRRKAGVSDQPYVIYTLSEPALLVQLGFRHAGEVRPVGSLGLAEPGAPAPQIPSYLVWGNQAEGIAGFPEELQRTGSRLRLVATIADFQPSQVVRLDSRGPLRDTPPNDPLQTPVDASSMASPAPSKGRYLLKLYALQPPGG